MFVQVIKGKTSDPKGLRRRMDEWRDSVRPNVAGYLGGTAGVNDDGTFVVFARFADEAAAAANNARPEQQQWFEGTRALFDGEPTFRESSDVSLLFDGGADDAGFVQVMEGTVTDRAKVEALETPEMISQLRAARPDLLGSLRVWFDDGSYAEAAYFTSEDDARKGESSADFSSPQQEYMSLFPDMTFTDLPSPQLTGPNS
jgi:hypothetical protein